MQQQAISHPTKNGELPSFQHPSLAAVIGDLDLVLDCWDLLRGDAKKRHLPKEQGEPTKAYEGRLARSSYPSFYRDGINAFAGVLSRYELRNAPKSLVTASQDIDGEGNSLKKWGLSADALVLRDGGCLLMADRPAERASDRGAEGQAGRWPFFSMAERRNVLNWRLAKVGRRRIATAVTVLEWHEVDDGQYGRKLEPRYRVMRGGDWRVLKIVGDGAKGKSATYAVEVATDDDGKPLEGSFEVGSRKLTHPPVVWYSAGGEGFGEGSVPLLSLANLTLDWFREYSDLKELLHRCALPVAWIRDAGRPPNSPLFLGPNSLVELRDKDSAIGFAEVNGGSLDKHLQHLESIEKLIDRSTLSFLFSNGSGQRTATQAELESAQLQATITGMAESKSSCWESLFQLWGAFTGDEPGANAGLDLLPGVTDKPVDDALLTLAGALYDKGLLLRETVTHLAQKRGMLPPGQSGKQEAQKLAAEDARQEALMNPPAPDPNSLAGDNVDAQGLPLN